MSTFVGICRSSLDQPRIPDAEFGAGPCVPTFHGRGRVPPIRQPEGSYPLGDSKAVVFGGWPDTGLTAECQYAGTDFRAEPDESQERIYGTCAREIEVQPSQYQESDTGFPRMDCNVVIEIS